jgi:transposase
VRLVLSYYYIEKICGIFADFCGKWDNRFNIDDFECNVENDEFIFPENQRLKFYESYEDKRKRICRIYKGTECKKCEFSKNCTKRKNGIRHLKIANFLKERKQLAIK